VTVSVASVGDECRWRVSVTSVGDGDGVDDGDGDVNVGDVDVLSVTRPSVTKDSIRWPGVKNGVQQSRDVRQPIGIATSRVAQLRQLLFIYGFGWQVKLCDYDPSLTRAIPERWVCHDKALYKSTASLLYFTRSLVY